MRITLVVTLLAVAIPIRPERAPPETAPKQPPLLGTWEIVKVHIAGGPDLPVPADDKRLQITATEMQAFEKGARQPSNDASYTVNWNAMPHTIDIVPKQDAGPKMMQGIFRLEADQLTLCFGIAGDRPANFNDGGNGKVVTMVLRRVR